MCTPTHRITEPFSPLDMHPHPSHLASPQTPALTPPPLRAHPAINAASPEPLEAYDVTEKTTKNPKLENPGNYTELTALQITTPASQHEPLPSKRPRFYITQQLLHKTNKLPTATLNPGPLQTARPATLTFDDHNPFPAHGDVRLEPTPTAPQPPPFSPLDMHPHTSHLASPLDMHPHPPHLASPQIPHLAPPPLPAPPALKHTRPDSLPLS